MDVKESKAEWTAWVVGLRPAKPDREPGGHEDRRARNRGVWEQWSPGRMGAGRWEGEGLVITAEPRERVMSPGSLWPEKHHVSQACPLWLTYRFYVASAKPCSPQP